MLRLLLVLLSIIIIGFSILVIQQHRPATAESTSGCIDIPADPDYLSTVDPHDAIAAINNARQRERLHPLYLPAHFYQLNPAQQQFILLNLERTDRGLHPLRLDSNLSQMALAYSKQLLDLHFFAHTSPISGTFSDRINNNSVIANHYSRAAENLAGNPIAGIGPIYEYMYDDSIENCGHRQNILNPGLALVGINWLQGGPYGTMSAQEFLTSAPWNPYIGTATPDTIPPQITITIDPVSQTQFQCSALATDNVAVTRITWFLDTTNNPLYAGAQWTLDTRKLSAGKHTLLAYAVDSTQNYALAKYTIVV